MHEDPGYVLQQQWLVKVAMINMDGEAALWILHMVDFLKLHAQGKPDHHDHRSGVFNVFIEHRLFLYDGTSCQISDENDWWRSLLTKRLL